MEKTHITQRRALVPVFVVTPKAVSIISGEGNGTVCATIAVAVASLKNIINLAQSWLTTAQAVPFPSLYAAFPTRPFKQHNVMLSHSFSRVGEGIPLEHIQSNIARLEVQPSTIN